MDDREILGTSVELPSHGFPYDDKLPDGEVTVAPMTSQEEKVLAGSGPQAALRAMDILIDRCVPKLREVGLKASDLVVGDRFFLMMVIRAVTYGAQYQFQLTCPSCSQRFLHTLEVPDDFTIYKLPDGFREPFMVELPVCKGTLGLRLLRGKDEHEIIKYMDRVYKNVDRRLAGDPAFTYRLSRQIESIGSEKGTLSRSDKGADDKILEFVEHLHARDTAAIRQALSDNDCGPDPEVSTECPRCGQPLDTSLPYSAEFFRPGGRRRSQPAPAAAVEESPPAVAGGE